MPIGPFEKDLNEVIYTALGAASVCWDETPSGIFDSAKASKLGEELIAWIKEHYIPKPENEADNLPQDLTKLLNRYSADSVSGTPDFILAEFLLGVVKEFNAAIVRRADWRGESPKLPALDALRSDSTKYTLSDKEIIRHDYKN